MNPLLRLGYGAVGQAARALAAVLPAHGFHPAEKSSRSSPSGNAGRRPPKLLRTLQARRGIDARFRAFGERRQSSDRPLLWMHAPSVGEALQARPIMQRARSAHSELHVAFTHFSPSAERFAASLDVDFHDYLPFDTTSGAEVALESLRPSALVFSKLDVWPLLTERAASRHVPLGLVSATLARTSGRLGAFSRAFLHDAYRRLDLVGAIDADDAERLTRLGVRRDVISVTGDTRYDQVAERAEAVDHDGPLLLPLRSERPTLVAGSTWPADEQQLLPAFAAAARTTGARMIIAPHELSESHLNLVASWGSGAGLTVARLGSPGASTADVVLVDRMGVLGDLYALADAAFVGGGFHSAGLHSVLEPAAFGAPVLFGPMHHGSRDALLLVARGGGVEAGSRAELEDRLSSWLSGNSRDREVAGANARAVVSGGVGAADRSTALVLELLGLR